MKTLVTLLSLTLLTACHTTQQAPLVKGRTTPIDFGKRPAKEDTNPAYLQANRPLAGPQAIGRAYQRK